MVQTNETFTSRKPMESFSDVPQRREIPPDYGEAFRAFGEIVRTIWGRPPFNRIRTGVAPKWHNRTRRKQRLTRLQRRRKRQNKRNRRKA